MTYIMERVFQAGDPSVSHHCVQGDPVVPAAVYLNAALSGMPDDDSFLLRNIYFHSPLVLEKSAGAKLLLERTGEPARSFAVYNGETTGVERTKHAEGSLRPMVSRDFGQISTEGAAFRCGMSVRPEDYYRLFGDAGISYGPFYRNLIEIRFNDSEAITRIRLTEAALGYSEGGSPIIHPALLDGAFQSLGIFSLHRNSPYLYVPFYIESLEIKRVAFGEHFCAVQFKEGNDASPVQKYNVAICDREGNIGAKLTHVYLKRLKAF